MARGWLSRCGVCWVVALAGCVLAQTVGGVAGGLLLPSGVAYDSAGNLFFADASKNQVFEVSLAGVTSVVAGTGAQGFAGDGGAATAALLNGPSGVAVSADGTLYIADTGNERVRAVVLGRIQTVAGNGVRGFSDGGGDARLAMLHTPVALAFDAASDAGSLLIADSGNHRVRRLAAGKLTTVAGTGVQGFAGDGGAAVGAQLDTPMGVAVAGDGRVFIADSHNHRLRVVAVDGMIATFAGSGVRGFGGDGGVATKAALFLPRGVSVTAAGDVVFADSDNHRLRRVDANGVITTIAGDGVQGMSAEGTSAVRASLDTPRGVAMSGTGAPVFSDSRNRAVQAIAGARALYELAPNAARPATVTVQGMGPFTYGQGSVTVAVRGAAPNVEGAVALLEGSSLVAKSTLVGAAAVLPIDTLSAGPHTLAASFAGDGLHSSAVSSALALTVTPAVVMATADPATVVYGSLLPSLSGTLVGVLPRDVSKVSATFASSATDLAQVGTYAIVAVLSGSASGNYQLATGGATAGASGLQIVQATANVTVGTPTIAYAGLPITLTASLVSTTRGTPTGTVTFFDNGNAVATANASSGLATAVYLNPGAGTHLITAAYGGDRNFLASGSGAASIGVSVMPDFTIAVSGSGTQTVQGGGIATYTLQVASQSAPFSGVVSFSTSGLQSGASVNFSPVNVVPGGASVPVTMSVQTKAVAMLRPPLLGAKSLQVAMLLVLPMWWRRKRTRGLAAVALLGLLSVCGCGARTVTTGHGGQTFAMTVTATSTNLAGAVVTHSVSVNLAVE